MYSLIGATAFGILLMFVSAFLKKTEGIATLSAIMLLVLLGCNIWDIYTLPAGDAPLMLFSNMLRLDHYTLYFNALMTGSTFLYVLLSGREVMKVGRNVPEYFALIFFILVGVYLLSGYNTMLMLFLGIEIISIPQYILAGSDKRSLKSSEASLKYFLLGAFSTGILLMGIALLYGATGTFYITLMDFSTSSGSGMMAVAGVLLMVMAFAFKVSAAPLHLWTPDVYDGSPTPFTAYMSTVGKAAPFFAFIRIFHGSFNDVHVADRWILVVSVIAAATLLVGNLTAVFQQSVKRMLAYSSIAQAGFMLFAVLGTNETARQGIIIYAAAYTIATIGLFAILMKMKDYTYDGFNGLAKREPLMAFFAAIFLFSLAGIPLTGGFMAKYYMLLSLMQQDHMIWLVIFGLLMAAVSAYYYFRVIMAMYFKEGEADLNTPVTMGDKLAMGFAAGCVILIGVAPGLVLWMA